MKRLVHVHTLPSLCTKCGELLDAATGTGAPSPGDISTCLYCGNVMAFGDDLRLRPLTERERLVTAIGARMTRH